jgi:hypothetical protein
MDSQHKSLLSKYLLLAALGQDFGIGAVQAGSLHLGTHRCA